MDHSMEHLMNHAMSCSINHTQEHAMNHSMDHSMIHSMIHSMNPSITHSMDYTIKHPINHTIKHSIDHLEHSFIRPGFVSHVPANQDLDTNDVHTHYHESNSLGSIASYQSLADMMSSTGPTSDYSLCASDVSAWNILQKRSMTASERLVKTTSLVIDMTQSYTNEDMSYGDMEASLEPRPSHGLLRFTVSVFYVWRTLFVCAESMLSDIWEK
ncbi:hypothetical protein BDF14DRAFT_1863902 [Spinellus fusiger]|nr:hypothetical protein BDF14DRAFT_1863902 [Spinellus fusiger]